MLYIIIFNALTYIYIYIYMLMLLNAKDKEL